MASPKKAASLDETDLAVKPQSKVGESGEGADSGLEEVDHSFSGLSNGHGSTSERKGRRPSMDDKIVLPPARELEDFVERMLKRAEEEDAKVQDRGFDVQVAQALLERGMNTQAKAAFIADLVRDFDPNRDGHISRMEFRTSVRKLLNNSSSDASLIDELFYELDKDSSGALDVEEMKLAVKKLEQSMAITAKAETLVREKARNYHRRAEEAQVAATAIKEYELFQHVVDQGGKKSIGAEVGAQMRKKGLKASEIIKKDFGKTEFAIFASGVLQVNAVRADLDALFDTLDDDHSGQLDMAEMRAALKKLEDEAEQLKSEARATAQRNIELFRAAKSAYVTWLIAKGEDERVEAEKEEKEALKRQEELAVEAQARDALLKAQIKKKEAMAAEKAAFEAKVQLKRRSSTSSLKVMASPLK
uniref:EF-hand domain-containing protein n=1 Tax=Haptolina brevifila TaxID=156173 RepID=A0A7S2HYG4_9EUKA|mmetsp:Transcript_59294/g.117782  ORF Transcript_59294/g.117782 Transcript_59294/m.117782 type:complete len:418 (+) Transcript_59294:413-1666(+)